MADFKTSDRGFKYWEEFETDFGHVLRISESSAAMEPKLWLWVTKGEPRYGGDLPACDVGVHMTLKQAERLRDNLDAAIKNHYQVDHAETDPNADQSAS